MCCYHQKITLITQKNKKFSKAKFTQIMFSIIYITKYSFLYAVLAYFTDQAKCRRPAPLKIKVLSSASPRVNAGINWCYGLLRKCTYFQKRNKTKHMQYFRFNLKLAARFFLLLQFVSFCQIFVFQNIIREF